MSGASLKYNPGLRGDQDLVDRFTARTRDLSWILDRILEAQRFPEKPCQHLLTIGTRGMGKTTLVRRVAAEVKRDPVLAAHWYPIIYPEESYLPSTAGEFWLEGIFHLAEQLNDDDLRRTYSDLRREPDESRLYGRCLSVLLEYAQQTGKRLLFVVENLGMLLGEQISESAAWQLRQTLAHEPRILMLATATAKFEQIDGIDHAWFELFATHQLEQLSRDECTAIWMAVNGTPPEGDSIRAVQILTGGNLRLLTIVAEFSIKRSFRELMDRLVELVDSHTEYFKSHLDALPAQERKVFAVLLDLWHPATAAEVAEHARLTTNVCSALLKRLTGRGAVTITGERKRDRRYQVTERLFNIYYLMRRRGEKAEQVRMLVSIMRAIYSSSDLKDLAGSMAQEIWAFPEAERGVCLGVLGKLAEEVDPRLLRPLSPAQLTRLGAPEELVRLREYLIEPTSLLKAMLSGQAPMGTLLYNTAELSALIQVKKPTMKHLAVGWTRFLELANSEEFDRWNLSAAAANVGALLLVKKGPTAAEQWAQRATELDPDNHRAWQVLAQVFNRLGDVARASEAIERSLNLEPSDEFSWIIRMTIQDRNFDSLDIVSRSLVAIPHSKFMWTNICTLWLKSVGMVSATQYQSLVKQLGQSEDVSSIAILSLWLAVAGVRLNQADVLLERIQVEDRRGTFQVLAAALALLSGKELVAAPEVLEVARDLAGKIRVAAAEIHQVPPNPSTIKADP